MSSASLHPQDHRSKHLVSANTQNVPSSEIPGHTIQSIWECPHVHRTLWGPERMLRLGDRKAYHKLGFMEQNSQKESNGEPSVSICA